MDRMHYFSLRDPNGRHWRIGLSQSPLLCFLQLQVIALAVLFAAAGFADEVVKEFSPGGTIVDVDQEPIADATITLHRWDGEMSPALETAMTDASGQFEFPVREQDAYYYVAIRKPPYAPIKQLVSADGPITATLRPAVETWVDVRSETGDPLQGARIANLSIRTPENTETYISRGWEHLLGFEFAPSDDAGRLDLPPLPEGALVDIRIDHPRWAQAKLTNVRVAAGRLSTAMLPKGVMTTFEFVADSRTPMTLDGLTCETLLLSESSSSAATVMRLPMTITGNRIEFCAHPDTYKIARLKAPGVAITPVFDRLTIQPGVEKKVRFLVRKAVDVLGRVMRDDGTPHKGVRIYGEIESVSPEGAVPGTAEWTYYGGASTDADGKFTMALPPGRSRVRVYGEGFETDRDFTELVVDVDRANEIPEFVTGKLEPLRGRVVDEDGEPVPGAIVRFRHPSLHGIQPAVCDAAGRFDIALTGIPRDLDTEQRCYELDLAAYVADQPLWGVTRIDLRDGEALQDVGIVLQPEPSADSLLQMEDNGWYAARRAKLAAEPRETPPAGERSQPAPELDGIAWLNTDARSLEDFRGRYVLLDFWFIGCGPCHADFPSVNLVHERFAKHGVTVIGVHNNSSTPDAVREHCQQHGLTFPIVVDHPDERILSAYQELGVRGYPSYLLIGPDGTILENDERLDGPPLRVFKLEVIRKYVLERRNDSLRRGNE